MGFNRSLYSLSHAATLNSRDPLFPQFTLLVLALTPHFLFLPSLTLCPHCRTWRPLPVRLRSVTCLRSATLSIANWSQLLVLLSSSFLSLSSTFQLPRFALPFLTCH